MPQHGSLLSAVRAGDAGTVRKLLDWRADHRIQDLQLRSPLHLAAAQGHAAIARLFLAFHADVDAQDVQQRTPLHHAVMGGHMALVRVLLQGFAGVNIQEELGNVPLHFVARTKSTMAMAAALIHAGSKPDTKNSNGLRPLHLAAKHGQPQLIRLLIASQAHINDPDSTGCTPLAWSAFQGALEAADVLIQLGAFVNARDSVSRSPLHWAIMAGHVSAAALLLQQGADIIASDAEDFMPETWAKASGHSAMVAMLSQPHLLSQNTGSTVARALAASSAAIAAAERSLSESLAGRQARPVRKPDFVMSLVKPTRAASTAFPSVAAQKPSSAKHASSSSTTHSGFRPPTFAASSRCGG